MGYCSIALLTARYGAAFLREITDRGDVATGQIDEAVLDRAIADADALIDGYLKPRYALPIAGATPPLLIDLSLKVSIYNAHANVAQEKIRKDYEDALKMLRDIAAGTIKLDAAGVEPAASGSNGVQITDRDRPFTHENLRGY